jgi:hypothetical protein
MTELQVERRAVFGAGPGVYGMIGGFAAFFLLLGVLLGIKRDDWTVAGGVLAATMLAVAAAGVLKLEIRESGLTYRNFTTWRSLDYAMIARAQIDALRTPYTPQGVPSFYLWLRDGRTVQINLLTFPLGRRRCCSRRSSGTASRFVSPTRPPRSAWRTTSAWSRTAWRAEPPCPPYRTSSRDASCAGPESAGVRKIWKNPNASTNTPSAAKAPPLSVPFRTSSPERPPRIMTTPVMRLKIPRIG